MTPTLEQIRQALANQQQPPRTLHSRVRDALLHLKHSKRSPSVDQSLYKSVGIENGGYGQEDYAES
jgi:hypothetical protein